MRITLNDDEKCVMKKYGRINLALLMKEDFYGHYYVECEGDSAFVKAKKRGLNSNFKDKRY